MEPQPWQAQFGGFGFLPTLTAGMRLLEVGCARGGTTFRLSRPIHPGLAVGVDLSFEDLAAACRQKALREAPSLAFVRADGGALPFAGATFDGAFTHLCLELARDPVPVLREMVRVVRPGGHVWAKEPDVGCLATYPVSPALERVMRLIDWSGCGQGDTAIGRRLPELFTSAGLTGVRAEMGGMTVTAGDPQGLERMLRGVIGTMEAQRPALVACGATPELLDDARDEAARLQASPGAFFFHAFCTASGVRA